MATPWICAKCGAALPDGSSGEKCAACGSSLPVRKDEGWRKAVPEWFVLIAAVIAGISAYINS